MFYEEKEINELTTCPYCKNKYDDPRALPCGLSMCFSCIQILTENLSLSCVCKQSHKIPIDGFFKNTVAAKLTEKRANDVYRSEKVEELKQNLKRMKQQTDSFNKDMNVGRNKIIEYFNDVKNEVQLKTEKVIEAIKQHSFDILKQIDDYQNECLMNYDRSNSTCVKQQCGELKKSEEFYAKWSDYLSKFSISENDISIANQESSRLINSLDHEHYEYKCKLFGDNLMKFKESESKIDSWLIGGVIYESFSLTKAIKRINNQENVINVKKFIPYNPICVDILDLTENEIFVLLDTDKNHTIHLNTIDYEFNLIKQITLPLPDNFISLIDSSLGQIKNSSLELIYLFTSYKSQSKEKIYKTKVFNQNLSILFEKEIKFNSDLVITIFKNNIFCLFDSNLDYSKLHVYDENLNELERYGQSNENLPFYFSNEVSQLFVNENYYIINENDTVKIIDRNNGIKLKTFSITSNDFYINLYMDRFILAYANKEKYLCCYDIKKADQIEESMQKFEISENNGTSLSHLLLVRCFGKNCFIYDCEERLFYI
jgi:hypothetical protein